MGKFVLILLILVSMIIISVAYIIIYSKTIKRRYEQYLEERVQDFIDSGVFNLEERK